MAAHQTKPTDPNSWTTKQKWIGAAVVIVLLLIGFDTCGGGDEQINGTRQAVEPAPKNQPSNNRPEEREDPNAPAGYKRDELAPAHIPSDVNWNPDKPSNFEDPLTGKDAVHGTP